MTNEDKLLFDALHEARVTANKVVFQKRAFKGVRRSVVDKYSDIGHFIYELIQNADDAFATEVYITLKEDRLLFKHNGTKHFDITPESDDQLDDDYIPENDDQPIGDINAITGIGNSNKENNQNKIGKFGVGFKSVFQYTDTPEIYDDTFKFKIEHLIIPTLIEEDYPGRKKGETLFVLPFRDKESSYSEIKQRLENLINPILFLNNLKKIFWTIESEEPNDNQTVEYTKRLDFELNYDDIKLEKLFVKNALQEDSIFLFSRNISINNNNGENFNLPIYVGFYYDELTQSLITDIKQVIYCFFPTKESFKSCFISHAPFLLTDNRQNIKRNEVINKDLIRLLSELAAKAVLLLRDYGIKYKNLLINENIVDIVPNYKKSYFFNENAFIEEPLMDAFTSHFVSDEPIFLSRNNNYLTAKEAYTTTSAIYELLTREQFLLLRLSSRHKEKTDNDKIDFLKWELIMKLDQQKGHTLLDKLDIKGYIAPKLALDITERFMEQQNKEWVTKFYTFLRNDAPKYWNISPQSRETAHFFRDAPIIKTQSGRWVAPFINVTTPNIFLPLVDNQSETTDYNFINKEYLDDPIAAKFFNELEIRQPDQNDYIRNHILAKYKHISYNNPDEIRDTLASDFGVLLKYYQSVKDTVQEDDFINHLKQGFYLIGTDRRPHKPSSLYSKDEYLFSYFANNALYLDFDYYKLNVDDYKPSLVFDFISKLGVKNKPSIIEDTYYSSNIPSRFNKPLSAIDYYMFYKIEDWSLDGFQDAFNKDRINKTLSIQIWNHWINSYTNYQMATIYTRRKRHQNSDLTKVESTFIYQLKYFDWIYDKNGVAKSATDLFIEDLAPEYNVNNGLPQLLGIFNQTQNLQDKYGVTNVEQQTYEYGTRISQAAGEDVTEEEIIQMIEERKRQKKAQRLSEVSKEVASKEKDYDIADSNTNESESDNIENKLDKRWEEKKSRSVNKPHSSTNTGDETPLDIPNTENTMPSSNGPFFSPEDTGVNTNDDNNNLTARAEQNLKKKDTQAQNEAENAKEQVEILDLLKKTPEYTYKWYKVLMELMHAGQRSVTERRTQIDFAQFSTQCSNKILELTEPSLPVPAWLCDAEKYTISALTGDKNVKIEGIIIKTENDTIDISIELNDILQRTLEDAKKIRVVAVDNTNIIDSLETRFLQLEKEDDFNMKENLPKNLEFIYGPPGTGKTTELVKQVHDILINEPEAKILVLTPTNKAADVVAIKMADDDTCYNGLARYGATESLYLIEDIGCLTNRDTTDMDSFYNIVVATAARFAYDYIQPDDTPICDYPWDYIFIDEASMIDILTITYIIFKGSSSKKIIISGDPKQIQPVVQNDMPAYNIYDMVDLHEFADAIYKYDRYPVKGLMMQHRSIPTIGNLVSKFAYGGLVDSDPERSPQKPLTLDGLTISNVNFIGFEVADLDEIRGLNAIGQSAFNLYSVLFTYNMIEFTVKQIEKHHPGKEYSIGVVCAYRAQSDAIKNMLENRPLDTQYCKISSGTVHSFQGDECDIMFIVLNPPLVCTSGAHVNNENIINVAMSRARDYIFFIMPKGQQKGFFMKNRIGECIQFTDRTIIDCRKVESAMFQGNENYIYENTHVTCHMPVNVYSEDNALYEVRMSDDALDIKINQFD